MLDAVIVGKVIQNYREKKGLSQEVVSGFADIGRTHLSAIERGIRKPTLDTFFKISEAMNIAPSELMKLIENELSHHS
ncbi:MAG: helix-turn-helix transcriptional regulator [Clostridia bacterium]|nr:helix-turn-helix transcriptional regulator [Clostridia bacterium]